MCKRLLSLLFFADYLSFQVKSEADISKLSALLKDDLEELTELLGAEGSAAKGPAVSQPPASG